MKVVLERNLPMMAYKVWFFDRDPSEGNAVIYHKMNEDGRLVPLVYQKIGDAPIVDIPPTLILPEDAVAAFAEAAIDYLPPNRQQAAHLADTMAVRDRLLTLVERGGTPKP